MKKGAFGRKLGSGFFNGETATSSNGAAAGQSNKKTNSNGHANGGLNGDGGGGGTMSILGNNAPSSSFLSFPGGGRVETGAGGIFKGSKVSLSSLFHTAGLTGTLGRKKGAQRSVSADADYSSPSRGGGGGGLAPPMPPIAPAPKLRRVNSSTLSLTKHKRKMLTLEDLYVEILYTILHMIGCDVNQEQQMQLIQHLRNAFFMEEEKHQQLLDIASMREEPDLKVNLEIVEARDLIGKDMSGSSDPFCTFYLTTNPKSRYNTSYKPKTLNPQWNEEFVLNVNSVDSDCLRVDVWDFNPEEKVGDKFRKINEIQNSRGLRKFIKETLNATTGNIAHELLGSVEIPLKDIPASGVDEWYALQKPEVNVNRLNLLPLHRNGSAKSRGDIRIQMGLSTEKDQNFVPQEYRHLLKILFTYELHNGGAQPFTWNGTFSRDSVTILSQHAVQGNLTVTDTALARWLVYAHTHADLPLDYRVFVPVLNTLKNAMNNSLFCQDDETRFVETSTVFVSHCMGFIKKHRNIVMAGTTGSSSNSGNAAKSGNANANNSVDSEVANTQHNYVQLEFILKCLKILHECLENDDDDDDKTLQNGHSHPLHLHGGNGSHPPQPLAHPRLRRLREDSTGESSPMTSSDAETVTSLKSIPEQVEEAVNESILCWFHYILEEMPPAAVTSSTASVTSSSKTVTSQNECLKIKNFVILARLILSDLKDGGRSQILQKLFTIELQIDYCRIAFAIYDENLAKLMRPVVQESCGKLKQVTYTEGLEDDPVAMDSVNATLKSGTSLFELYLDLQSLAAFGKLHDYYNSAPDHDDVTGTANGGDDVTKNTTLSYHRWFSEASTRWLDIALFKAMQRITKAVALDQLKAPVDELVQHSSSAVDLRTVLIQIKTFWKELNWPDAEEAYALMSKILDDVCKVTIFYADQMCRKVVAASADLSTGSGGGGGGGYCDPRQIRQFGVTEAQCLAINNIDYVLKFIRPFATQELGIDDVLTALRAAKAGDVTRSSDVSGIVNACRRTLTTLVQNAVENVENKIFEVLDTIGSKMAPVIQKFLVEGTARSMDNRAAGLVVDYLDKNLIILKEGLTKENFDRVLSVIWESSAQSLNETIQLSIERRKPPDYFAALLQTLDILINFFYGDDVTPHDETLMKMRSLLELYASDSADLISKYFGERYKEQRAVVEGEFEFGSVTVRCQILREHLRIEVLNARHLKPPDPIAIRMNENNKLISRARRDRLSYANSSRINLTRSQRNLAWVKSKWKSLRSNLHEASVHFHTTTLHAGQCDPYVTLRLVPNVQFPNCPKQKTRPQRRTLFPLFDETFDFVIHYDQEKFRETYLLITVKDNSLVPGGGVFLGEALMPLSQIPISNIDQSLRELPQLQLPLTKPSRDQDSDIILALDSRGFDRLAKQFLQKEKRKV